jgi:hydroxymethylbilane synthase
LLAPLNHEESMVRVSAERALLAALEGSCRTPIAALAEFVGADRLRLRGLIATPDGRACHRAEETGGRADAEALGRAMGEQLKAEAGPGFFEPAP